MKWQGRCLAFTMAWTRGFMACVALPRQEMKKGPKSFDSPQMQGNPQLFLRPVQNLEFWTNSNEILPSAEKHQALVLENIHCGSGEQISYLESGWWQIPAAGGWTLCCVQ